MYHVNPTTPLLEMVSHLQAKTIVYLYAKFNDSSFNRSLDITGAQKIKMDHVTLTTPLLRGGCGLRRGVVTLREICHPYAGIWHPYISLCKI